VPPFCVHTLYASSGERSDSAAFQSDPPARRDGHSALLLMVLSKLQGVMYLTLRAKASEDPMRHVVDTIRGIRE